MRLNALPVASVLSIVLKMFFLAQKKRRLPLFLIPKNAGIVTHVFWTALRPERSGCGHLFPC